MITDSTVDLRVNRDRLWTSLMELARIGATPKGGVCRLALSELDGAGRDLFIEWARTEGCEVRIDKLGNIVARRAGTDPLCTPVMTGSHLDTQPTGGKFDGIYGVMAGLEVIRTLNERDIRTVAPIELAVWTNEEGTRFSPVMMGSGVFSGVLPLQDMLNQTDGEGIRVEEALSAIGYDGEHEPGHDVKAYFEAHIEQGPILENTNKTIGVVTGAMGQRWYDIEISGLESHAGSTPMETRRDALITAARLVIRVNEIAHQYRPDGRGTVGCIKIFPNSRNIIPGNARLTVEFRNSLESRLVDMDRALHDACDTYGRLENVDVHIEKVVQFEPRPFAPALVDAVRDAAIQCGYPQQDIVSGAAHDAVYLGHITSAAMIFVPCKDGLSHNELEDATPEDLEAGANVLLHVMLEQAGIAR